MNRIVRPFVFGAFALSACTIDADPPTTAPLEQDEARIGASYRVQAGERLVALGATDDDVVLYWGDGSVWATPLRPGAPRRFVARADAAPLTMIVGRVALIWTSQPVLSPLGPSALTVWTSDHGARLASSASWPPALSAINASTAVSPDGREIVFTTNVSADGSTGDIVRASTDLGHVTTLVAGASVSPFGACPPHVGFDRDRNDRCRQSPAGEDHAGHPQPANAVVAACPGTAPTATLARWVGDHRTDLTTNLLAGRWWSSDASGDHLYAVRADGAAVVWDRANLPTVVETRPSLGWMNRDGSITANVRTSATTAELVRVSPAHVTSKVMDLPSGLGFMFANHVAPGFPFYNLTTAPTSPDGRVLGGWSTIAPNTGLTDVIVIDTATATRHVVHAAADALPSNELTTPDSSHVLFYAFDQTGGNTLFAAARDGSTRRISEASTDLEHYGLAGSVIAFSDHAAGDPSDLLSTTDIELVDVAAPTLMPRTIAQGVHQLYFPALDRRVLIYTTEGNGGAGLYAVRVR